MKNYQIYTAAALVALLGTAQADWLQFRGERGSAVSEEKGLPQKLAGEKSIAWKKSLPGRGLSSPIVVSGNVIVTASSGSDQQKLHILSFDAKSGEQNWVRSFWATGRTMTHKKTCVAAPTPVSDGTNIYAFYSSNDVISVDLDGNLRWLRGLTDDYANASNSLGMSSSPVIADGTLVVQVENDSESFAAGLDLATGVNKWKVNRPKVANWTSPVLMDEKLVALQSGHGLSVRRGSDGYEVWNFKGGASTIPSSAIGAEGVVYVPSNGMTALRAKDGQAEPEQLWQVGKLRPGTASPVVSGDRVYVVTNAGFLMAADTKTGEDFWKERMKGPFGGSPVIAGDYLYIVSERGTFQIMDLSGEVGKIVGELELGEMVQCTPAISDGGIFVRSDGHLWRIGG